MSDRKRAIETLKQLRLDYEEFYEEHNNEVTQAYDMAISSLETDEAYQLEYESTTKNDLEVDNQNIRLIDANALIKRLRPKHFDWWGEGEQDDFSKGNNSMLEEVIEAIEELPSVTPQEPRKGHWIKVTNGRGGHECDVCHDYAPSFQSGDEYLSTFCPNCGAKMVEPQKSEDKE